MAIPDTSPDPTTRRAPSAPENAIPPRGHHVRPRNPAIPPQPTAKTHVIRTAIATALGVAVMFVLLMLAAQYLQRDWSRKQQQARTRPHASAPVNAAETPEPAGWAYVLRPAATDRQMARLQGDRFAQKGWSTFSRGLSDKTEPRILLAARRMALAHEGESAELANELGAIHLRQKRLREASGQFHAALQLRPGFPPALFNLALCSLTERDPTQAIRWLGRYLGQRPADVAALRQQAKLVSQLGQPREALLMLEKFLKDQPPAQPLFLEAASLAARLGQNGKALRYLETSLEGNPIQSVVRAYQSPVFREIRLSGEGDALAARMAAQARVAFAAPVPAEEIQPLLTPPSSP